MPIRTEYEELKLKLIKIELTTLLEAQAFVVEKYWKAVKLESKREQKPEDELTIDNFLSGKWDNGEVKEFCASNGFRAEIDFRHTSKSPDAFDPAKTAKPKTKEWLVNRLAFYWLLLQKKYADFNLSIDVDNIRVPIYLSSKKYDLRLHQGTHDDKSEYIGFYPRSKKGKMNEIGVFQLIMYTNESVSDEPYHKGNCVLTVYYRDYHLIPFQIKNIVFFYAGNVAAM